MRPVVVLGAFAGVALAVSLVTAQEATPPAAAQEEALPAVFQVTTLELEPGTMREWRDGLRKQAAAAKALNLPATEVGWWAMNDANRTMIIRPHSRDELFINPQLRQKIRALDAAMADDMQASFQAGRVVGMTTEILEHVPNLSYQPAIPFPDDQWGGIVTREVDIVPGQNQAFNEALQRVNNAMAAVNYPYPRNVYRVRMGRSRTLIVIHVDSLENYYGTNWAPRLAGADTAAGEELRAANQAFLDTISSMQMSTATYARDMSYPPGM